MHFVRVFAGRLTPFDTRTGQTPEAALERLPGYLELLRERKLRAEITCLTDTAVAYDQRRHVESIARIAVEYQDVVFGLEAKNEIGHSTQAPSSYQELIEFKDIARSVGYDGPFALGAALGLDELDPANGKYPYAWTGYNAYSTIHLNRDKKPSYREAFRVKEQYDVMNAHGCGVCNNEPGRFDHDSLNEPDGFGHQRFAYLLGVLGIGFGLVNIAHGSQMRDAQVLTGIELDAFNHYLRAAKAIPRGHYSWKNANNTGSWPDSPIKSGAFAEGPANSNSKALWRAYSFIGDSSFVVAGGEDETAFNLEYQNGWTPVEDVDTLPGIKVIRIEQRG